MKYFIEKLYQGVLNLEISSILISLIILTILGFLVYFIWWHLNFRYEYSETRYDTGVVTDMEYTASHTSTIYNGKSTTTTHHPAIHRVFILGERSGKWDENDEELYQSVRLDDKVKMEYREKFRVRKSNQMDRVLVSLVLDLVISPKGRSIEL